MALVEGVKYGLSSHNNQCGNKSVIFVKLTDSALRAIDDYLKSQHKTGHCATLRFLGNEGNIHIPSSINENGHSFDFSLSTNTDIEGPQRSFECIQQCGPRSLESAGPLSYKMRIKANDDVFVQTQHRFNELEHERRNECAKEIKSNCADIGRKVKKKIGMPPLPQRREKSPSYHPPPPKPAPSFVNNNTNSSLKLPKGYNNGSTANKNSNNNNVNNIRKVVSGGANGNATALNATGTNNSSNTKSGAGVAGTGNQDISRRPLKERLIHMLAVKPYKKPEIYQRLQNGMKERDKKVFMTILQQIASFKDNEYSLLRGVWNDVQEDWPFCSEQERQLMKRRKPQNLTPPGSDSSVGSGSSSLSPRSNSSIGSGHSPSNYGHVTSYSKTCVVTGSSDINYKGLTPPDGNYDFSKGIKRPVSNGILADNAEDYGNIPPKKNRVAHIKKPGSNGTGANTNSSSNNSTSRADMVSKLDKDNGFSGSSPQFSSHSNRIAERLSPIGTSGSSFSAQNSSNGTNDVVIHTVNNHKSPRNGNVEPMEVSPPHQSITSNGYHSASHVETVPDEAVSIGSSWQSRNGNDPHGFSDCEKPSRGDSDETDSVDSGNGSSTSAGSLGGSQQQNYSSYHHTNNNNGGSHPANNGGGYTNGPNVNIKSADKSEPISSSVPNSVNSSSITNGCNRVSSTTNFHTTAQSSPDSQVDTLQQKSISNVSIAPVKHNQRSNGKCNAEANPNIEIVVTREKGDSHRDRDRMRNDRDRGNDKERDVRNKDRTKRNDKKYLRVTDERDGHEIENSDGSTVKLSSEYPSYLTKYTTITCPEQRSKYKEDFNGEYPEYRDLHTVTDSVSKRFAHLEERLRKEERGTDGYEKIKEQIVNEYYANKRNKKYQETRQKFQYLHEKLSHIKRLVADYDSHHQQEQDTPAEYVNGFLRN